MEDQSGKKTLDILVPKMLPEPHTFRVHAYRGIGHIPKNMKETKHADRRILLENVPKLLRGYGKTHANYPPSYRAAVILVCDLDDRCLRVFREELFSMLNAIDTKPETRFCIAIEEGEAWFLGDLAAIKVTYPRAKDTVLNAYKNDEICGTWEKLADAIYPGGSRILSAKNYQEIGLEKSKWAEKITPNMNIAENRSPSFQYFRDTISDLCASI